MVFHVPFRANQEQATFQLAFPVQDRKQGEQVIFGFLILTCYDLQTVNLLSFIVSNHYNTG